jgi:hypothetical protein
VSSVTGVVLATAICTAPTLRSRNIDIDLHLPEKIDRGADMAVIGRFDPKRPAAVERQT